ncbi:MAG TPA: acylneuraminate cytidylyltransferase family protein [Saccharofermentans sp.]|nr:acylneuraminate cytidylyltransferase family protein [Saccharofermentans sp.]
MYLGKKIAAIVPARGGSKGVLNKNIKPLLGLPLIGHTLQCILDTGIIDFVTVSTDSEKIAAISKEWTNEIIHRPPSLASDTAKGKDVIVHAIDSIKSTVGNFDYYFYLQPTSPLRSSEDIVNSLAMAIEKQAIFVVGVCECEHNPMLCNHLKEDHCLKGFVSERVTGKNRQEFEQFYRINGAIYLISNEAIELDFYSESSFAYIMPQERSIDIDTELDFLIAEVLLQREGDKRS